MFLVRARNYSVCSSISIPFPVRFDNQIVSIDIAHRVPQFTARCSAGKKLTMVLMCTCVFMYELPIPKPRTQGSNYTKLISDSTVRKPIWGVLIIYSCLHVSRDSYQRG